MQTEEWRPVPGWEGFYSVSDAGRIRSEARVVVYELGKRQTVRERIMSPATKKSGHKSVILMRGAETARMHVHRMVLLAFKGAPPTPAHEGAHGDGNPGNNRIGNLRWATSSENHRDKVAHGTHNRGDRHPNKKITDAQVREIRATKGNARRVAKQYGITWQHVFAIRSKTARRFA